MYLRTYNSETKEMLGNEKAAIFLSQLYFWYKKGGSGHFYKGKKYVYATVEEWSKQLGKGYSLSTIHRILNILSDHGLIERERGLKNPSYTQLFLTLTEKAINHFKTIEEHTRRPKAKKETKKQRITKVLFKEKVDDLKTAESLVEISKMEVREHSNCDSLLSKITVTNNKKNNTKKEISRPFLKTDDTHTFQNRKQSEEIFMLLKPYLEQIQQMSLNEKGELPEKLLERTFEKFDCTGKKGTYIACVMVKIWNLLIPEREIDFYKISPYTGQNLCNLFGNELKGDFLEWVKIIRTIKSSNYMFSSNFELSLKSSCKSSFIEKIRKKELGVKDDVYIPETERLYSQKTLKKLEKQEMSDIEKEFRSLILNKIGDKKYRDGYERSKINWEDWDGKRYGYRRLEIETRFPKSSCFMAEFENFSRAFAMKFPLTKEEINAHQEHQKEMHKKLNEIDIRIKEKEAFQVEQLEILKAEREKNKQPRGSVAEDLKKINEEFFKRLKEKKEGTLKKVDAQQDIDLAQVLKENMAKRQKTSNILTGAINVRI